MIKRGSLADMTDFLQMPNKLSSKRRRQINKSKQKASIEDTSSRKAIISSLESSNKKELPVPIPVIKKSERKVENIDIAMISANVYHAACHLKRVQVFAISVRNIQYQAEKKTRAKTDPKSVILQEYHDFLNVFSKKDLDTFPPHQKYDHKIYLEKE